MSKRLVVAIIGLLLILSPLIYASGLQSQSQSNSPTKPLTELSRKPLPGNLPWYIVVLFGDNRPEAIPWVQLPDVFYNTINELVKINAMVNVGLGDHVGQGSKRQFLEFYRVMKDSGLENQMYAMGNHDISFGRSSWKVWQSLLGPLYLDYDEIPGWRLGILDTEVNSSVWEGMVSKTFTGAGNRSILLAFHKPVIPYVHHNLQDDHPDMAKLLLEKIKENGNVRLIVQAHWHGWAHVKVNGTDWIISGSTGAPLYKVEDCEAGVDCVSTYNYLAVILYPNGTYKYYPVKAGRNSGSINITIYNNMFIVSNSKVDVHGNPVEIPVRLVYNTSIGKLYVPLIIPANSKVIVRISGSRGDYILESNASNYYAYILNRNGSSVLLSPSMGKIKLPNDIVWINPVKPRHVLNYNEYQKSLETTTTTIGKPTSETSTHTPNVSPSSSSLGKAIESRAHNGKTIAAIIVIVLVVIVALAYSRIKR